MKDSEQYLERKAFFERVLTVYGRKPVLEVLQDPALTCHQLHLADNNREDGIITQLRELAQQRELPIKNHSRAALARISRNGRQDQGVALDVLCPAFQSIDTALDSLPTGARLLALDSITNPQNLGMIIRSAAAGAIDGIIYAKRGNAALGPLVIKASAGTVYKAPLLLCDKLPDALKLCRDAGMAICALDAKAEHSLFSHQHSAGSVFVLGNESEGVSKQVQQIATHTLSIPMRNGVESLNVAVTASLIAFASELNAGA
ncbi:RNA methyltransferase [Parahaliea sp. F7430]|uniref:RNA methyltransferase n=1 Tax=Sediminihaliea albiluteola TaxID=2758564 RepID=A0A7W2TUB4_9GAMM|nr:RNA methyltransferase [Sediminihaliea albiluteola]MBA6412096.1 RNA methyltransferase [Sediminihaliea albiluteola]